MKIHFYLHFHTKQGEELYVSGNTEALGNNDPAKAVLLQYMNDEFWRGSVDVPRTKQNKIEYHYIFKTKDGSQIREWGDDRLIEIPKSGVEEIQAVDVWNHAGEYENVFF